MVMAGRYIRSMVRDAETASVRSSNALAPPDAVLVMVIVSVPATVVIDMPVPATSVRVSVAESATTEVCPATAMVLKLSDETPPPVELIVIVSVPASVVMVILVPATKVNVSVAESATTFDCPATAIVAKLSAAGAAHVLSPLRNVVTFLVPAVPSLSTGTVPESKFVAFSAVILAPLPLNDVAVSNPTSDMVAELFCIIVPVVPS
jgi:hypothetical protein